MAGIIILKILRGLVKDRIQTIKDAEKFVVNGWELAETYFPFQKITDLPEAGKCWVMGLASDDAPFSRSNSYTKEIPIHVGFQKMVSDPRKVSEIDPLIQLEQQLREAVAGMKHPNFSWVRTESLKDSNDTPFAFVGLREHNIFEAYFTAFFTTQVAATNFLVDT